MAGEPVVIEAAGVTACLEPVMVSAAIRHFDAGGAFAAAVGNLLGGPLPAALTAARRQFASGADGLVLWRSPTEVWVVGGDSDTVAAMERLAAGRLDGCVVELTGALAQVTLLGRGISSLLTRLGPASAIPQPGQAFTARFAELPVTAVCLQREETILLVERAYAAHLWAWIRETLADWQDA